MTILSSPPRARAHLIRIAHGRARAVHGALAHAPLHRGRILRGLGVAALSCTPPIASRLGAEA